MTTAQHPTIGDRVIVSAGIYAHWLETQPMPKNIEERASLLDDWTWMKHVFSVTRIASGFAFCQSEDGTVTKRLPVECLILFQEEI